VTRRQRRETTTSTYVPQLRCVEVPILRHWLGTAAQQESGYRCEKVVLLRCSSLYIVAMGVHLVVWQKDARSSVGASGCPNSCTALALKFVYALKSTSTRGTCTYSYMLVIYNRNISRRVLAAEMLLPIHTSHISCHPDIILSRHEIGLTYRRETYTNLSARTVGAA
jgi:hypothetical protein